jgi:hypothetical protein
VVLPEKSFLCVGGPAQLGARPPQSLQRYRHSALVSGLPESINLHRRRYLAGEGNLCVATVASSQHPLVTGGPYLVQPDTQGQITIAVKKCSPIDLDLQRNDFIGSIENIQDCEAREVNPAYLQAVAQQQEAARPRETLSAKKK